MASTADFSKIIVKELAFSEKEREELKNARVMPIRFDEDCPETTPEQALKFKAGESRPKRSEIEENAIKYHIV